MNTLRAMVSAARSSTARWPLTSDRTDWLITLVATAFWVWFAWQHGYENSPDSWYRGLLARSIIDGDPYLINVRQGWLYDYPAWHPDAAHPPLLPALYALYFYFVGPQISISNVIVSLSAGLLVFPLLRLSRLLTGGPIAGVLVYLAVAFNDRVDFLFEVFNGLSIPVALALLATGVYFMLRLASTGAFRDALGGVVAFVGFYYVRPGEQLIFVWLMLWALILGLRLLPRRRWISQMQMWGAAFVIALPWAVRNLVLLGNPFFNHATPSLWTDRRYDYWDYHETVPLPSAAAYFATHTAQDVANKILSGAVAHLRLLNEVLSGQLLLLAGGTIYALVVILLRVKEPRTRYTFGLLFLCLVGYSILYSMVQVLDKRYMISPQFAMLMIISATALLPSSDASLRLRLPVIGVLAIYLLTTQAFFWGQRFGGYLKFSYTNSDQELTRDPTILALKQRVRRDGAVLGAVTAVQRLNVAMGLTLIEQPDNLRQLKHPAAFFRRYQIRYALTDVGRVLPDDMIESIELAGNSPLFVIRLDDRPAGAPRPLPAAKAVAPARSNTQDARSVAAGLKARRILVDGFHGVPPSDLRALTAKAGSVYIGTADLVASSESLMRSGLYVLRYGRGKPGLTEEEFGLVERFVAAGGRVLLLLPAWVPLAYERQDLSKLSFNRIAQVFGLFFSPEVAAAPLSVTGVLGGGGRKSLPMEGAAFSNVIGRRSALDLATDAAGNSVALGQVRGKARAVLWGHDNLFEPAVTSTSEGRELQRQILDWLPAGG